MNDFNVGVSVKFNLGEGEEVGVITDCFLHDPHPCVLVDVDGLNLYFTLDELEVIE